MTNEMKRLFFISLLMLCLSAGCAGNIRIVSTDIDSKESILVGHIETVPVLWEFSLYEEKSQKHDQIDRGGEGFGLTESKKLENKGYIFKVVRPGIYVLRVQKKIEGRYDQDNILRLEVPEGKLVYFGTIKIVIDKITVPSLPKTRIPSAMKFNYHYAGVDEDETLKLFAGQYPQVYSSYKDKIVRIPLSSQPKRWTPPASIRADNK